MDFHEHRPWYDDHPTWDTKHWGVLNYSGGMYRIYTTGELFITQVLYYRVLHAAAAAAADDDDDDGVDSNDDDDDDSDVDDTEATSNVSWVAMCIHVYGGGMGCNEWGGMYNMYTSKVSWVAMNGVAPPVGFTTQVCMSSTSPLRYACLAFHHSGMHV